MYTANAHELFRLQLYAVHGWLALLLINTEKLLGKVAHVRAARRLRQRTFDRHWRRLHSKH